MKRRRLTAALGAATLVAVFAATYYIFYLKRQTAELLAARKPSEAVERYERIQEAFKEPIPAQGTEPVAQDWPPRAHWSWQACKAQR